MGKFKWLTLIIGLTIIFFPYNYLEAIYQSTFPLHVPLTLVGAALIAVVFSLFGLTWLVLLAGVWFLMQGMSFLFQLEGGVPLSADFPSPAGVGAAKLIFVIIPALFLIFLPIIGRILVEKPAARAENSEKTAEGSENEKEAGSAS